MRIITHKKLNQLTKQAYERGLALGYHAGKYHNRAVVESCLSTKLKTDLEDILRRANF